MTVKRNTELSKREALIESWRNRKNYKGYDKSKGSLYNTWRAIIYTQKGKNIGFPETWRTFDGFQSEISEGWQKGFILTRIDITKPYSKDNVIWSEKGQENLSKLITLEYNGEIKTLVEWCHHFNLNYNGARQRYFKGKNYTTEEILFGKLRKPKKEVKDVKALDNQQIRNKASKMLATYRNNDNKKGFFNNIEKSWFIYQITNGECCYCGSKENLGLDRIDNAKGHTMDNVVVCCRTCNVARSDQFTVEEFKKIGVVIRQIMKERKKNENN